MPGRGVAVVALALSLTAAACGARLSDEEKAAGVGAGAVRTAGASSDGGISAGEPSSDGAAGGGESSTGTATPGAATAGAVGATGGATSGQAAVAGCRPAGASDTGVSDREITIANVSDVSGPVPGLFKSAQQAVQAYVAYQNSLGGVCGRQLKLLALDSQTDAGHNRERVLEACSKAFALVGSMAAFDNGGAEEVDKCGIPDLTAIPTNSSRANAKMLYPAYPNVPQYFLMGAPAYIKENFPDVIAHAGMLWIDGAVTREQSARQMKAMESIGFKWDYTAEYSAFEANFTSYVIEMRSRGIQYVTAVADASSLVRLQQAMRQQNYIPKVRDWNSVVYDPSYISQGGAAVEGSLFYVNTALFEEVNSNPELKLYTQWLNKVAPGAKPTYFGIYAWSAARLFATTATTAGAKLTRAGLVDALKKINKWDANGLHAPNDVGNKIPGDCHVYSKVQGGKFVRVSPASGLTCDKAGLFKF